MKCINCPKYKEWSSDSDIGNECLLLGFSNFKKSENCIYINDDGVINKEELDKCPY